MAKKIDRYAQFKTLAKERGYNSPQKMLTYLYNERRQSKYEIRAQLKCSWEALRWAFKEYGIKTRHGGANRRFDIDEAEVKLYCKNHTQPEAATHFKCSQMLISRIINGQRNFEAMKQKKRHAKFQALAKQHGYNNPKEMLTDLYVKKQMSKRKLKIFLKVHWGTMIAAFQDYGIEARVSEPKNINKKVNRFEFEFNTEGFLAAKCKVNACKFCSNGLGCKLNPTCENCRWRDMHNKASLDRSYPTTRKNPVFSAPEKMYTLRGRS